MSKRRPRISGDDLFRALYDAEQWNRELYRAQSESKDSAEDNVKIAALIKRLRAFRLAHFGESAFDVAIRKAERVDIRAIQLREKPNV